MFQDPVDFHTVSKHLSTQTFKTVSVQITSVINVGTYNKIGIKFRRNF